jgi:hypothetical protein
MTPRERVRAMVLEEWARRRARCAAEMAEAKKRGDFVQYREAKAWWQRFFAARAG